MHFLPQTHPEEGIQRSVFHKFGDDEDGTAAGQDALQPNHVGVIKLAHDGGFGQEVPPLALCVARLQRLDGHHHLPAPGLLDPTAAHLPKFTWGERTRWWEWGWGGVMEGVE